MWIYTVQKWVKLNKFSLQKAPLYRHLWTQSDDTKIIKNVPTPPIIKFKFKKSLKSPLKCHRRSNQINFEKSKKKFIGSQKSQTRINYLYIAISNMLVPSFIFLIARCVIFFRKSRNIFSLFDFMTVLIGKKSNKCENLRHITRHLFFQIFISLDLISHL